MGFIHRHWKDKLFLNWATVGQWVAGPSFNQGVGGSIPALVDVSLSKTLNPELLPAATSTGRIQFNSVQFSLFV